MDAIETVEYKGCKINIYRDDDAESPREWDNLGTMLCWHRRYTLGDKNDFASSTDFRESDEYKDIAVFLPLYLYDHSGLSMRTRGFSDPWDSGQVGYIYVTKTKLRKEHSVKRLSKKIIASAEECLKGEVETFDQYLTGQVYGYQSEDSDGNDIGSCWGFFGDTKYMIDEAKSEIDYHLKTVAEGLPEAVLI